MPQIPAHFAPYIVGLMGLQLIGTVAIFSGELRVSLASRKTYVVVIGGLLAAAAVAFVLVWRGTYAYTPGTVPLLAVGLGAPVILGLLALRWAPVLLMVRNLDPTWLMALQFLRAFGLIFPLLADLGHLARPFASAAGYGDIAVGVLAPFAAYLWVRSARWGRKSAVAWNVFGIFDIFGLAIVSYLLGLPGLTGFGDGVPNTDLMNAFPLALIPVFIAPFFVLLHFYTLIAIRAQRSAAERLAM